MKFVGVIGAGQMGAGIAQVAAAAGYDVLLADRERALADKGVAGIAKMLARSVDKEKITAADRDATLGRIRTVDSVVDFGSCDLVIEAATEREEIKRTIFADAGKVLGTNAILASNTSSIPITRLAQAAPDPSRFIGVHFFNPVPVMGLIELIRGLATSDATLTAVEAFGRKLGKEIVHANDAPGFIVNRVLMPMINEAIFALGEGVASMRDIDTACRLGLNHPMGPITLADFHRARHLPRNHPCAAGGHGRPQIPPRALAREICRGGLDGQKIGPRFLRLDWA